MAIKVNAIKISQRSRKQKPIYLASVAVKDLVNEAYFKVDWWEKRKVGSRSQGYQRIPAEPRIKKIGKYLESISDSILPSSILINARDNELEFKKTSANAGELTIEPYPCYIVDGQTRVQGFKYAISEQHLDLSDFEVPVIFLSNFDLAEELEQFYILNTTQKRVSTDLAQRLKMELSKNDPEKFDALSIGEKWELTALVVIDLLNQESKSTVWQGRIRLPNTKKSPLNIVNQNSFVQSLKPLYKGGILEDVKPDDAYDMLRDYWEAVSRLYPDAFSKPKDHVIQKTPGLFSLHDLANRVFKNIILKEKKVNVSNIMEILGKVLEGELGKDYFWHKDNYIKGAARAGSMKGFGRLAEELRSNLEKIS
jgi:DGQHR domain-containing protein